MVTKGQRRRQLARARLDRQRARRLAQQRRRRVILTVVAVLVVLVALAVVSWLVVSR